MTGHPLSGPGRVRPWLRLVAVVARRPSSWGAALRQARVLVPRRWWRRAPFLPVPDPAWMRFRMTTAYGRPDLRIEPDDLVTWLTWTSAFRVVTGPAGEPAAGRSAVSSRASVEGRS